MKEDNTRRDRELFQRIAQGDAQAFATFFEAYSVDLAGYVARILRSELWAEEIVQDVFMKIWQMREQLPAIHIPAAFLHRMLLNRAKDHLKHLRHEIKLQYFLTDQLHQTGANDTQNAVDFRFGQKLYDEAVNKLPRQRALVFKLRHEQGLTYEAIAQELNISPHTVRNLLNLATQQVRQYMLTNGGITGSVVSLILFANNF